MAPVFYNAWVRVMDLPLHRLYCTWHVDRSCRNNLSKINSREKHVVVYRELRALLQETDKNAFSAMLNTFLESLLGDTTTVAFGEYFNEYYARNVESWAYCYRINTGLNTNMHIENMHRGIKYIDLNGKVNKRLDQAIYLLIKFVRDKLFNHLTVVNKGKMSTKLKELRARHKTSDTLDINSVMVNETGWTIPSSSTQDLYQIEERQINCNCKLVCSYCEKCLHSYSCSCLDSSIKWNMCKHIHLLCKFLKTYNAGTSDDNPVSRCLDKEAYLTIDENLSTDDQNIPIVNALTTRSKLNRNDNFMSDKEKFIFELLKVINSPECSEELDIAKQTLAPLVPTLTAFTNLKNNDVCNKTVKSIPHNKKIAQQRR
ncbi:hypothetical protein HUJ04_011217, partial [Dendroctonus ponderosae]